jgi:hypothetical protein
MGSSSKKVTVGYKYYVGMHMILCQGPIDKLFQIKVADKVAWTGDFSGGALALYNLELFGGESREGGVAGQVDFEPGGPSQGQNSYLVSKLGPLVPNFRGMAGIVLRKMYMGLNPYLKTWSFKVKRIHTRQNGIAQWYDAKAGIGSTKTRVPAISPDPWYVQPTTDWFIIGAGIETSGGYTQYQGWFTGYIDSLRVTRNVGRYTGTEFTVPSTQFENSALDPYWDDVVTLLLFEGANNDTFTTCEKGHTTTMYSGAKISTEQSKFGNSSGKFDRTLASWVKTVVGSGNVDLGSEFTIEAWIYETSRTSSGYGNSIFSYGPTSTPNNDTTVVIGGGLGFIMRGPSIPPVPDYDAYSNIETVPLNKWVHVAVVRKYGQIWLYIDGKLATGTVIESDMNPAHIIRECLTDPYWGMGYQDADIDDTSFTLAADTLYSEGMGMSLLWESQTSIEDFIKSITKHIDAAVYVDISTGKFVLKLIRDDYSIGSLITLNESNIDKISDFSRPQFGELTNSITVTYWDMLTEKDATITIADSALVQMQNCTINASIQYPGFTNVTIASKVAQRDLKTLSTPLITCTIYTNKDAASLNIGKTFKLTWPDYDLTDVVMRVTGIGFGDGKSNRIRLQCVQDVFSTPSTAFIPYSPPAWVDPVQPPTPCPFIDVFEAPYLELVQLLGQSTIDSNITTEPNIGYIGVGAIRPGNSVNSRLFTDNGSGYLERVTLDYSPGARLNGAIIQTDTTFPIDGGVDLDTVTLGTWAEIDNEIVCVTALNDTSITVKRGCLDTLPALHADNTYIVFWDEYGEGDQIEYVTSDTVNIKVCPVTGDGILSLSEVTPKTVVMGARAVRPYPPANIKIAGSYYPASLIDSPISMTWNHRDRKQQTAGIIGFTEASIGPEAGVTYSIRLYNHITSALLHSVDNLTGTSYSSFPSFTGDYTLRLEMWSIRSTYQCFQKYVHTFSYLNTTYLLTESSDNYITESGDFITME